MQTHFMLCYYVYNIHRTIIASQVWLCIERHDGIQVPTRWGPTVGSLLAGCCQHRLALIENVICIHILSWNHDFCFQFTVISCLASRPLTSVGLLYWEHFNPRISAFVSFHLSLLWFCNSDDSICFKLSLLLSTSSRAWPYRWCHKVTICHRAY